MFYIIPTKKGLGVEIWGTADDLEQMHKLISAWWANDDLQNNEDYVNRDQLISSFSYELRHGYQGDRLKRDNGHFSFDNVPYLGFQISWVHALFTLSALKRNGHGVGLNKYERAFFLQFEFWLERAMYSFDTVGAEGLTPFIEGAIYAGNPCLYQFMRSINMDYFLLKGGKVNFRKLSKLMARASYSTHEYKQYWGRLQADAARLKCKASELDFDEEDKIYEIEW